MQQRRAFALIENWLNKGTEELQTAVTTGFLESIINAVSWERISASSFAHFLGPESKKYCKAWDEFTGVKTEGLWDDD